MSTISIFGSSRPLPGEPEYQSAYEIGKLLATAGFDVCNGGYGGTMEASARGAKEAGGRTIGVVADFFSKDANAYIDQKVVMGSLSDRLMRLIELGDGYVVLKGSTGTLLELAAVWEFMNKRVMREKPIIVIGDYWMPVVNTLGNELHHEGLEKAVNLVVAVNSPGECVRLLEKRFRRP